MILSEEPVLVGQEPILQGLLPFLRGNLLPLDPLLQLLGRVSLGAAFPHFAHLCSVGREVEGPWGGWQLPAGPAQHAQGTLYLLHRENLVSPSGGARWTHWTEVSAESMCLCSTEEQWLSKLSCELNVTRQTRQ